MIVTLRQLQCQQLHLKGELSSTRRLPVTVLKTFDAVVSTLATILLEIKAGSEFFRYIVEHIGRH